MTHEQLYDDAIAAASVIWFALECMSRDDHRRRAAEDYFEACEYALRAAEKFMPKSVYNNSKWDNRRKGKKNAV